MPQWTVPTFQELHIMKMTYLEFNWKLNPVALKAQWTYISAYIIYYLLHVWVPVANDLFNSQDTLDYEENETSETIF